MQELSPAKQKILLLLLSGLGLGLAFTPRQQLRILKNLSREWKAIDERKLNFDIRQLYRSKLVEAKENEDGSHTLVLTSKGKMRALTYHFFDMEIKKETWDGKWRLVIFDIPETFRKGRDALREKLVELGFREFQKSVFVFPYECRNEIEFVIEFFQLRKYVRYGTLYEIDNDLHLRKIFHLI